VLDAYIPLKELADISLNTGASYIYHVGVVRYIPIKFSVRGHDLEGTVKEAQDRIAKNVSDSDGAISKPSTCAALNTHAALA